MVSFQCELSIYTMYVHVFVAILKFLHIKLGFNSVVARRALPLHVCLNFLNVKMDGAVGVVPAFCMGFWRAVLCWNSSGLKP